MLDEIDGVCEVLPPRAQQRGARLPASKQSEAERYEINVFNHVAQCRSAAGSSASPFCGCPATLCEACGLRRPWAQSASTRSCLYHSQSEAKAGRRTERSEAGAAHRSGCSRSARSPSGAEWRSRGAAAEPPHAKRCALRRAPGRSARLSGAVFFAVGLPLVLVFGLASVPKRALR